MDGRKQMMAAWQYAHDAAWYAATEHQCEGRDIHRIGQGDKVIIAQLCDKGLLSGNVAKRYAELQDYSFDTIYRDTLRTLVLSEVEAFIADAQIIETLLWQLVSLNALPGDMADSAFNPETQQFARRRRARKGDTVPLEWV